MAKLHSIWLFICKYKYIVVTLAFLLLLGFAGDGTVWQRILNLRYMAVLRSEINEYVEEFESDTRKLDSLQTNPANMEWIARERYLMKKPNEDVFVFEEDLPRSPVSVKETPAPASAVPQKEQAE